MFLAELTEQNFANEEDMVGELAVRRSEAVHSRAMGLSLAAWMRIKLQPKHHSQDSDRSNWRFATGVQSSTRHTLQHARTRPTADPCLRVKVFVLIVGETFPES